MTLSSPSNAKPALFWHDINLGEHCFLPAMRLDRGEHLQVICPDSCQHLLLETWFCEQSEFSFHVMGSSKKELGGTGHAVGVILNGRALLANLTIKENIMLPFLYHQDLDVTEQLQLRLREVTVRLGLDDILYEQAGVRSPLVHGLVSLSRCLLQQASFIIMQQPCASMDVQETEIFSELAKQAIKGLDAGMVYLTTSAEDQSGFVFTKHVDMQLHGAH